MRRERVIHANGVQAFEPERKISFHYKLYIDDGQWHLWFTMGAYSYYYEPEFNMRPYRWEHVGSWPRDIPFVEEAVDDILTEWFLGSRPQQMPLENIEEIGLEATMRCAKEDDKEWLRMKRIAERQRAEKLAEVLTA